jgi:hypothetical protein
MRRAAVRLLAAGVSATSPAGAGAPGSQRLGDPPVTNEAERYVAAPIATGSDGRAVALIQSGARVVVRHAGPRRMFGRDHPVRRRLAAAARRRDRGASRALCSPGAHATGPLGVTADGRVTWRQAQGSYAARVASGAP